GAVSGQHGEAQSFTGVVIGLRHGARQVADAADVGGALGDADGAARVEQVKGVGGFQRGLVGGQRQGHVHQALGFGFIVVEVREKHVGRGVFEVVGGLFDLVLVEHVAVQHTVAVRAFGPDQVVHAFHALQVHGQAFQAVGDFAGSGRAVEPAHLLEVGELGDFHAVEPDFPAQAPRAQRGVFPVVFDEADVVPGGIDAQRLERTDVQVEDFGGRRLQHDLVLVIVLQAVGVFAVAAVFGPARGLHVGGAPGLGADGAQEGGRMRGAGADFHVVWLQQGAALLVPVVLERK